MVHTLTVLGRALATCLIPESSPDQMVFTMTSAGSVRRIPCWETSHWMQSQFTSVPSVSDKVEQQTKVTRRCGASQQTWMTAVLPASPLVLEADFFTL